MNSRTLGTVLIVSGLVIFASMAGIITGDRFLIMVGVGLIVCYALYGYRTGLLVAGTCLSAVGIFTGTSAYYAPWMRGPLLFLLLGLAFSTVYLVETIIGKNSRWALYPTFGLLGVFGLLFLLRSDHPVLSTVWGYWPVALIGLGLWLILVPARR